MHAVLPAATRVIIAGPDGLFRGSLRRALGAQPDLDIVGEAVDTPELLDQLREKPPDVVLVDAELPPKGGCHAVEQITRTAWQQVRAVVLADRADDRLLFAALESGADGFVTMDNRLREIAQAIRSVTGGHAYVPPRMLADLLRAVLHRRRAETAVHERFSRLTRREREVLALLTRGQDHTAIAHQLVISPQTARSHIQNVLTKLEVHSRVEAASFALENDLLPRVVGAGRGEI